MRAALVACGLATATALACWFAAPQQLHDASLELVGWPDRGADDVGWLARLLRAWIRWADSIAVEPYDAAVALSSLAAGIMVGIAFACGYRSCQRTSAATLVALLCASCPAVVLAGTAVHVHAIGLLLASATFALSLALVQQGGWLRLVATGVLAGITHALVPIGPLTPLSFVLAVALGVTNQSGSSFGSGDGVWGWRRITVQFGIVLALELGCAAVILDGDPFAGLPASVEVGAYDLRTLLPLFGREWLRDFLPLSAFVLVAVFGRRHHRAALLLTIAAAAHVVVTTHLTSTAGDDGAHLLPLVLPAALLVVARSSARTALLLVAIGAVLGGTRLWLRSDRAGALEFVAGLREAAADETVRVVAGPRLDVARLFVRGSDIGAIDVDACCRLGVDPAAVVAALRLAAGGSIAVFVTDEALAALRDPVFRATRPGAAALLRLIDETFDRQPVQVRGFGAQRLVPR